MRAREGEARPYYLEQSGGVTADPHFSLSSAALSFSSSVISDDRVKGSNSGPLSKEAVLLFFAFLIHPLTYILSVFPCAGIDVCPAPF